MEHSFNIYIAKKYGIPAAVLLKNIQFWIEKNKANEVNLFDGHYWTYNSKRAFAELFPYLNPRQIDYALQKLIDDGLLITGNYNKVAYDRTLWYAITKKGYSILQNCEMDLPNLINELPNNVQPIPDIKADVKNNIKTNISRTASRLTPPTLEEVKQYCFERNNNVDAERFIDYYTSNGWKVGKNPMKDWKAAVRTWERSERTPKKGGGILKDHERMNDIIDVSGDLF